MMKRFKKQNDLIRHAIKNVFKRQVADREEHVNLMSEAGDFLQQCAMKLRMPR